jgi:ribosomal protein L11 methyltransferase
MHRPAPLLRPDTLLYIYYIEGIVPAHFSIEADTFIGNWVEDDFSFLFFTRPAEDQVQRILALFPELKLLDEYAMTYGEWQGGSVEPVRIGRFLLNPAWIKASPGENDISITLDSGVVFGNGAHPTTQACLEAIDIACAGKRVTTMLDLGSGTGILALAAAKLGCRKIVAVDYNYLATRTARANVALNQLDDQILVVNGRAEEFTAVPTDLLVANIHYAVMRELVRTEGFLRQKWFILSGLLRSEAEKITGYLNTQPVLILKRWNQDDIWHTILGITNLPEPD